MLETERLLLRRWRESDLEPFAAMNSDPAVMEFFPAMLDRRQSDALAGRADASFDDHGFGLFAVEVRGGPGFIGFVGLSSLAGTDLPVPGDAEVGWRLARSAWGNGYAPEAARAALWFGFGNCAMAEIVSFAAVVNERSQSVMRKIGLRRDPADDFQHPRVEVGSALRPHVCYRLTGTEWAAGVTGDTSASEASASTSS